MVAVFDKVEFKSLTRRKDSEGAYVFAPSHSQNYSYGFLVINSKFTSDGNPDGKKFNLGQAWDESSDTFKADDGKEFLPNGMVVIRSSWIRDHIDAAAPWSKAASTNRPFDSEKPVSVQFGNQKVNTEFPANRLFEYRNSGPGSAK